MPQLPRTESWIEQAPDRFLRIAAEVAPYVGRIFCEGLASGQWGTLDTLAEDASTKHFDAHDYEHAHDQLVDKVADLNMAELPEDVGKQLEDAFVGYGNARAEAALLVGLAVGAYLNPSVFAGGAR